VSKPVKSEAKNEGPDESLFSDLIGKQFLDYIFEKSPKKVATRVGKALDHFDKAIKLKGLDEEMGAIRLIAAEEELVVAIFEWLKLNADKLPKHDDFIKKYKNHYIKLAFVPVLSQFKFILGDFLAHGFGLEGLEQLLHFHIATIIEDGKILLEINDVNKKTIWKHNPLAVVISWEEKGEDEVLDEIFSDFSKLVSEQQKMTIRQFVSARAEFRNKLLYADDSGFVRMEEDLSGLIEIFKMTFRDLLWTLAILLGNDPPSRSFGLPSQFITLYRRVLNECKLI
jgi:hypothetical protein